MGAKENKHLVYNNLNFIFLYTGCMCIWGGWKQLILLNHNFYEMAISIFIEKIISENITSWQSENTNSVHHEDVT